LPLVGVLASNRQVAQDSRVVSILSVQHPFAMRSSISINRFDTEVSSRDGVRRLLQSARSRMQFSIALSAGDDPPYRTTTGVRGCRRRWPPSGFVWIIAIQCIFNKSRASIPPAVSWYCRTARVQVVELIIFNGMYYTRIIHKCTVYTFWMWTTSKIFDALSLKLIL